MVLHLHRDKTDAINLVDVANDFVGDNETRKSMFRKFSNNDLSRKSKLETKSFQTNFVGNES